MENNAYLILLLVIIGATLVYKGFTQKTLKNDSFYLLIIFLILFTFSIIRSNSTGIDSGNYQNIFNYCSQKNFLELFNYERHEIGYKFLNRIIFILGGDFHTLITIISAFSLFSYYTFIKKYSKNYTLSIALYISLEFFIFSFGIFREAISIGIILFAITAIVQKKAIKFYILVVLAFLFHYVALVFLPMYLLCKIPIKKQTILIWAITFIILLFTKSYIINFILTNIYAPIGLEKEGLGAGGYIALFFMTSASLLLIANYISNKKQKISTNDDILTKILLVGTIIQIFATYYSLLFRMTILFYTVIIILIPVIIDKISNQKLSILSYTTAYITLIGWYIYRATNGINGYIPYALMQGWESILIPSAIIIFIIMIVVTKNTTKVKN